MLIYGREIRDKLKKHIQEQAASMEMNLVVLQVGDDPASMAYVNGIRRFGSETGIGVDIVNLPAGTEEEQVLKTIEELNGDKAVTGVMIQKPLPDNLDINHLINSLDYDKDVEGIHNFNLGKLISGQPGVQPCTPKAVIRMLKEHDISMEGKQVTIVGRSTIVGMPLAVMMTAQNATVTLCHSRTRNLADETRGADILVAAVGKREFITPDMVKEGAVIIDAGINVDENGKVWGDVHEKARDRASIASAVPGGVGVITVAELFDNLCFLASRKYRK